MTMQNERRTRKYIEYYYPGILFSESSKEDVESFDPSELTIPDACFGFEYHSVEEIFIDEKWRPLTETNKSHGMIYPDGEIFDEEKLIAENQNKGFLLDNMRGNGWNLVVRTKVGNFQPFRNEDRIWDTVNKRFQEAQP
jgi:hypothetical protein